MYQSIYQSPLGPLALVDQEGGLCSVYFLDGQNPPVYLEKESPALQAGRLWLEAYFHGDSPALDDLPLAPQGTPFQKDVWDLLREVPYGQVTSYGVLARVLAKKYGQEKMSARAVGAALTKNPLAIILPCHRVLDGQGFLRGYAWGLERKKTLLEGEGLKIVQDRVIQAPLASFGGL